MEKLNVNDLVTKKGTYAPVRKIKSIGTWTLEGQEKRKQLEFYNSNSTLTRSEVFPYEDYQLFKISYTPEMIVSLEKDDIFVFGSNVEGRHGAGSAKAAVRFFGAILGQPTGLQGRSYAIATIDLRKGQRSVSLDYIQNQILTLIEYANEHPEKRFFVTKIGTNLAGYTVAEIAELFFDIQENIDIPANVILPIEFDNRY